MHQPRDVFGVDLSPENEALLEALGIVPDEKAARLLAGVAQDKRPIEWTPDLVKRRLSDAAEHVERMERRVDPRGSEPRRPDRRRRGGASAAEIRRAEQALEWPMRYLAGREDEREVLSCWLWCEAKNQSFSYWFRSVANCRGTANRRRDKAFAIIADGLRADRVAVE